MFNCDVSQTLSAINSAADSIKIISTDLWVFLTGFRIRIRINLSCWIRIRIQIADPDPDPGGQKCPTEIEKRTEFSCFEVLDVLF
jgi:hypothetical protein